MASLKFTFEKRINKSLKIKATKAIIESTESSPELRREIRRVFQMANRRIQNIEQAGLISPAVTALGKGDIEGYSKFSVKQFGTSGESWTELKKEYGKAIAFLQSPTSTASGAREFERQMQQQMNIPSDVWDDVKESVMYNYSTVSSELTGALPYTSIMQDIYDRMEITAKNDMERDAIAAENDLQQQINSQAAKVAGSIEALLEGFELGG